jgi:hypothetical protein
MEAQGFKNGWDGQWFDGYLFSMEWKTKRESADRMKQLLTDHQKDLVEMRRVYAARIIGGWLGRLNTSPNPGRAG